MTPSARPLRRAITFACAGLMLAACGSDPAPQVVSAGAAGDVVGQVCCVASTGGATQVGGLSTAHNGWDTAFISWLTPHDAVASQMAELAPARAGSQKVKDLAAQIDDATGPRYLKMAALAAAWGEPAPSTDPSATAGHDHGGGSSEADPKILVPLRGASFDRTFLRAMVTHHEAASAIVASTLANGTNQEDKHLAQTFLTEQTSELEELRTMLAATS